MKKTLNRIIGIFTLLGGELFVRGMITGQQNLMTIGLINIILGGVLLLIQFRDHLPYIPHMHTYRNQYGWTIMIFIMMRYLLRSLFLGGGLEYVLIIFTLLGAISFYLQKLPRLRRGKQGLSLWTFLGGVSLIVVVLIFQKHRSTDTPWLIVIALGAGWMVYALGMMIVERRTLRDPLLITRGLLTMVALVRATTTVLIAAYEDRVIETIVYQEKEIYLPAEQCLPDWGNIRVISGFESF